MKKTIFKEADQVIVKEWVYDSSKLKFYAKIRRFLIYEDGIIDRDLLYPNLDVHEACSINNLYFSGVTYNLNK